MLREKEYFFWLAGVCLLFVSIYIPGGLRFQFVVVSRCLLSSFISSTPTQALISSHLFRLAHDERLVVFFPLLFQV